MQEHQRETGSLDAAVDAAIAALPESFEIKPFLKANKAEVKHMCITEYDEAKTLRMQYNEGKAEGRAEGKAEGRAEGRAEGFADGKIVGSINTYKSLGFSLIDTIKNIVKSFGMTEEDAEKEVRKNW